MENSWWSLSGIYNSFVEYFWPPETQQPAQTASSPRNEQTQASQSNHQTPEASQTTVAKQDTPQTKLDTSQTKLIDISQTEVDILRTKLDTPTTKFDTPETKRDTSQELLRVTKPLDSRRTRGTLKLPDSPDTLKTRGTYHANDENEVALVTFDKRRTTFETQQSNLNIHLPKNPFVAEISEMPLLCQLVSIAQFVRENENSLEFKSLTSCFRRIVNQLCQDSTSNITHISSTLYPWAFQILKEGKKLRSWTTQELREEIGQKCIEYYQQKGILVKKSAHFLGDTSYPATDGFEFVDGIFCEWFAAHHIANILPAKPAKRAEMLQAIDSSQHLYVYRFVCGLCNISTHWIQKHLETVRSHQNFALLCKVEQQELETEFMTSLQKMCMKRLEMTNIQSKLEQSSGIKLMKIATWRKVQTSFRKSFQKWVVHFWTAVSWTKVFEEESKISIEELLLAECFSSVDPQLEMIVLKSGQMLPTGLSLKALRIQYENHLTVKDIADILHFASKCEEMQTLGFDDCNDVTNDVVIDSELLNSIRSKELQIEWFSREEKYQLNLQSGVFEVQQQQG